jgi:protein dithiol:quinone oxidoreductase
MNLLNPTPRLLFGAVFLACAALLGFGLVLQAVEHIEPCPMCVMQRYAFAVCGLIALTAAAHNPGTIGRRIYAVSLALAALAGGAVAVRQSWIQHFPPKVVDCGPDLEFMLDSFPLAQALPMIFHGSGDCSKVTWSFLGLSIAEWALIWFVLIVAVAIYLLFARRHTPDVRTAP